MIWRSMCIHGLGLVCKEKRQINQHRCCRILEQNVYRMIWKCYLNPFCVIFHEDNAPVHTTKLLQEWFSRQCFIFLP